jgi:hypothetical protein
MRDLARRLIAGEAAADETSASKESAVLCVYEKLRRKLCTLAGVAGFSSLASRALSLAKMEVPRLSVLQITDDGNLEGLGKLELLNDGHQGGEWGIVLIAQLLTLLAILVGDALALHLVQDVWPAEVPDDRESGIGRKA